DGFITNLSKITLGGIKTNEINSKTMESKFVNGLYFSGELLNLDGLSGGYNLKIAFSTGYLAGLSAANSL
ncbi:MAG: NAD(P)/FAD-dependent oxidoreductase, partial [Methanobrevibacter sp.]|nr:NAD(P)/FAD-dependent oxidoreductase [Methanobrevibacter sp.]